MQGWIFGLVSIVAVVSCSFEQALAAPQSDKAAYEAERQKLQRDNPKEYENQKTILNFATQLLLARLGYGVGPFDGTLNESFQTTLRKYQKNRGIPETGDPLSFETMEQVRADFETMDYEPIDLPPLFFHQEDWDSGFVSAQGTWTIANEKQAWPEQTSKIECVKDSRTCREAAASISRGLGGGESPRLSVNTETYEIERWDQHEIVTKPLDTLFGCVRYVLRLNRLQKSVTGIRSTISNKGLCKGSEAGEKHLVLMDGFKIYWDLLQESRAKQRKLLLVTPGLLERLETTSGQHKK